MTSILALYGDEIDAQLWKLSDNLALSVETISRYSKKISRTGLHFYFQRIKANHISFTHYNL